MKHSTRMARHSRSVRLACAVESWCAVRLLWPWCFCDRSLGRGVVRTDGCALLRGICSGVLMAWWRFLVRRLWGHWSDVGCVRLCGVGGVCRFTRWVCGCLPGGWVAVCVPALCGGHAAAVCAAGRALLRGQISCLCRSSAMCGPSEFHGDCVHKPRALQRYHKSVVKTGFLWECTVLPLL